MPTLHDFSLRDIDGNEKSLSDYRGKPVLMVNVASKCGLTPQYDGLQRLHERYGPRGLVVVGVPCNQFAGQEPGSEAEIKDFCSTQYKISFPLFSKIDVNGAGADPVYAWLTSVDAGPEGSGDIKWNFGKFLIDGNGEVAGRFEPTAEPQSDDLVAAIDALLRAAAVGNFDVDTRVERLSDGRYCATPNRDWMIWGPNGGYIASIALRAAGAQAKIERPSSFTCHFISVARFEPVEIAVEVLRSGQRSELIRATMRQGDRLILETLLRTAQEGPGLEHDVAKGPEVPHFDELPSVEDLLPKDTVRHPFWQNFETRHPDPARVGEARGVRPPVWTEWYRFRPRPTFDDLWLEASRSMLLLDTVAWPAAAGPHPDSDFIAPSLDVTTWFHAFDPSSEWLLVHHESEIAQRGLMSSTGRVYSATGKLLASGGSQLMCVPAPPVASDSGDSG